MSSHALRAAKVLASVPLVLALFGSTAAPACDTPVYRYAMYRWAPSPYEVYFFHEKPAGEDDEQTAKAINKLSENRIPPTNVVYLPVDLAKDKQLAGVPPDVKKAWEARAKKFVPGYLVVSPLGGQIYSGKLRPQDVTQLVDSPLRQSIAGQLEDGKATVLILLTCGDKEADAKAEKQLAEVVKDVNAGKIELYSGPPGGLLAPKKEEGKEAEDKADKAPPHQIGHVKVARGDQREKWLVQMLLAVEPDLKDEQFEKQPMVFAVYGRGRALPPFIGKGIDRDNLVDCVGFLTGACSCTVKEQNPGVDLLLKYDWETAAAKVAEKFGSEEGNERQMGVDEFFPDLIIGPSPAMADAKPATEPGLIGALLMMAADFATGAATDMVQSRPVNSEPRDPPPDAVAIAPSATIADNNPPADKSPANNDEPAGAKPGGDQRRVALAGREPRATPIARHSTEPSFAHVSIGLLTVGIGIAIGICVLAGATILLLRRQ